MPSRKTLTCPANNTVSGSKLFPDNFLSSFFKGNAAKRLSFFKLHKKQIHAFLLEHFRSEPLTLYRSFILNDKQGQERTRMYMNLFEEALSGNLALFFEDQKNIGYVRAMEGFHLNDVYGFTVTFKEALWRASQNYNESSKKAAGRLHNDDIFIMNQMLDRAYYLLSLSFLETRDHIISRHQARLEKLQRFVANVMSIFDEEKIWTHVNHGVFDVFGLNGTFVPAGMDGTTAKTLVVRRMIGGKDAQTELDELFKKTCRWLKPIGLNGNDTIESLSDSIDSACFRFITCPILDRNRVLIGVLLLHSQGRPFGFSTFDRNILYQFSFFTGDVLANCCMVSEIAEKRETLRNLTNQLISAQEEERKKIAADIHDVLTQALTGIGYKALYCLEIIGQDHKRIAQELQLLIDTINDALNQSRQIIENLRPHILDDFGVVAAFRKLIYDFSKKFHIPVRFSHPEGLQIDANKGIALFRILQEALHNIRRHSSATSVDLMLTVEKNNVLIMQVADNGIGFNLKKINRAKSRPGFGLLTMRERTENVGGVFGFESWPGGGFKIILKVPLQE